MSKKELAKRLGICAGAAAIALIGLGAMKNSDKEIAEIYTVKPNDTVWSISEKFLPEGKYILQYQYELLEANPEVKAKGCVIHPGDKIKIIKYAE